MSTFQPTTPTKELLIRRQPPVVPISSPQAVKPLPALPATISPNSSSNSEKISPPQPPQRVRSLNKPPTLDYTSSQKTLVKSNNNLLESASNEAAKLVYKTVMMGSVQNINLDIDISPPKPGEAKNKKLSVSYLIFLHSIIYE